MSTRGNPGLSACAVCRAQSWGTKDLWHITDVFLWFRMDAIQGQVELGRPASYWGYLEERG